KVTCCKFFDPFGRLLSGLCLKFDFQHGVWESFNVFRWEIGEREVDPNVHPPPIVPSTPAAVQIVFARHCQFRIQRYPDSCISGELKCCSMVKRSRVWYKLPRDDSILYLAGELLPVLDLFRGL